jgi:hypothetical protein
MTVEQSERIDGMGTDRVSGAAVLIISDHLSWTVEHLTVLEAKLASYLRFIESGQLREHFPEAKGACISVMAKYRPSQAAARWLAAAESSLAARGISLKYGPLPSEGYVDDPS